LAEKLGILMKNLTTISFLIMDVSCNHLHYQLSHAFKTFSLHSSKNKCEAVTEVYG